MKLVHVHDPFRPYSPKTALTQWTLNRTVERSKPCRQSSRQSNRRKSRGSCWQLANVAGAKLSISSVAEWLRRWTSDQRHFAIPGSNPTRTTNLFQSNSVKLFIFCTSKTSLQFHFCWAPLSSLFVAFIKYYKLQNLFQRIAVVWWSELIFQFLPDKT